MQLPGGPDDNARLTFYGGPLSAIIPFFIFVTGVIAVALSGAPDERGFWPLLILALGLGLFLSRDKTAFSRAVIRGMSQEIVMIMLTAWLLASIIGTLMTISGLVEGLTWVAGQMQLTGTGFVIAVFVICCIISLSTGSSFATILICGPILYPAGGLLGAPVVVLAGAIIAGATFGDFVAPISDTTIASAFSQKAEIGPVVRSRIKYIIPVFIISCAAFYVASTMLSTGPVDYQNALDGDPAGLPMLLVPVLIIFLFIRGTHLLPGLMTGLFFGVALGLMTRLIDPTQVFALDKENFTATSFVIDGMNRVVGISFFTILLMGLVETLKSSGLIDRLVDFAGRRVRDLRSTEAWLAGVTGAAVLLTTHSIVAILMTADFANRTGQKGGVGSVRRSNILSMVVCIFPFLLPYFIPVILMSNVSRSGEDFGLPVVSPLEAGMYNFVAWSLGAVLLGTILFGFGRTSDQAADKTSK